MYFLNPRRVSFMLCFIEVSKFLHHGLHISACGLSGLMTLSRCEWVISRCGSCVTFQNTSTNHFLAVDYFLNDKVGVFTSVSHSPTS